MEGNVLLMFLSRYPVATLFNQHSKNRELENTELLTEVFLVRPCSSGHAGLISNLHQVGQQVSRL